MTRRRIAILFLPALLLMLVAGAFAWLLHSEPGARWILQRVASAVPGQLTHDRLSGDLQSGLRVTGLRYRDESLSVEADWIELDLSFDFWPPSVAVHRLEFGQLGLVSESDPGSADPLNLGDLLPRLSLPLPVEVERLHGDRIGLSEPAAGSALEFRDLFLSGFWFRELELRELRVTQGESHWAGELEFDFQPPHGLALSLQGSVLEPALLQSDVPLLLQARGSGNLGRSHWELEVADPPLAIGGEVSDLLGTPAWDLQLEAGHLQWPLFDEDPSITGDNVTGNSYGAAAEYGAELSADIGGPGFPPSRVRIVGAGNPAGLDFELIDASGEAIQFQGSGRLDWQAAPTAHAELDVARLDPTYWMEAWGDAEPLQGQLQLSWSDQEIGFELGEVTAAGTLELASGSGALDLQAGALAADLEWRGFAWPPGAAEPVVTSNDGRAVLGGRLEQWTVSGELALSGPDFPPGRLQVRGGGDGESLHLAVPQGSVLGGSLAGQLDVGWSPDVTWAVEAQLNDVATGPLAPDFPGQLSGEIAVRGRPDADSLEIDIRDLAGLVRQRRVQAQGLLVLEAGRIAARNLTVRSGESRLTLDGHPDGARGLAFTARIADLSDLVDGVSGSVDGSGTIALGADRPRLRLEGKGDGLAWDGNTLAGFSIATEPGDAGEIRLEMAGIDLGEQRIESLVVVADGARPLDRVSASAEFPGARFEVALDGRVQDWSDLAGGGWVGQVQQLRFEGEGGEFIELEDPVEARFNATAFTLEPACFRGSREGRLCLESTWRPRGERTLAASLEAVSPNLAMTLLDSELLFSQRISGELEWRQQNDERATARARLQISAGEITAGGEKDPLFQTGVGLFAFEVSDGRLYAGNLDIPVPGSGGIDTDFSVPDLSDGLNSPVQGRLRMNFNNIEPFLRLVPGVEGSSGPMAADLNFSGTLSDPQLTGHASVVRGTVSHFASGLLLEDIRLAGAVYRYDQAELSGTFRAGSGQGSLRAVVNFDNLLQPEVLLQVKGDGLTLVNVPSLNVTANPDVRLVWRGGVLNLDGKVAIPTARVSPLYLPTSATSESADLVIVAGEDPLVKPQESKAEEWRLHGNLELELGDDVRLTLDRAQAQLRGNSRFTWDGQVVPIADGGFVLSGEILAYGQLLRVTEGRINFSNRPADNPFLNIRAEREIFGNSQIRRAGVLVTGTLKQPVFEPYSVPMTTRERALTLLVTGSDFDYERGVGSVEVGMYVAPRLFISYGIGLFEDQNVISARYDLGRGFGIKTTSGQRETGADISYTIER